ncbi:MAG: hypothetical protein ABJA83_13745 [Burkholderiaceae bacterium]
MNSEIRNTRRQVLAMLAALGVTRDSVAQDAATSDPRSFRVVLDNERVRVLEYKSGPGFGVCGQGLHYHPERVTVSLTGAKMKVTNAEGRSVVGEVPAGHVSFAPPVTHSVENIGGSGTRTYIIELKGQDWKPSTG